MRGEFKPPLIGTCELRTGNCKLFVDASIFFYHNLVKSLHRIYFEPVVAPSGNGVCIMTPRFLLSLSLPIFSIIAIWLPLLSQAQTKMPYWSEAAPPTVARQELYPEVVNGKIYVVGGLLSPNTGFSAHFESYDPVKDAWTVLG